LLYVQLRRVCVRVCAGKLLSGSARSESLVQRVGARTKRMTFPCHLTYRVGLSASSASFFIGQKLRDDLWRALNKPKRDMRELNGRLCVGREVKVYSRLCVHASLGLPQCKEPIGYPYMLRNIENTEQAIKEIFVILQA